MVQQVAFPMYVLPPMQADMRALWKALKAALPALSNLPEQPRFDDPLVRGLPDDLLMMQYCGYPYITSWRGKLAPLACLHYDAPFCEGSRHRSVVVVHKDSGLHELGNLRGKTAAINGYDSNTGMNLLRHAVAHMAQDGRFFGAVIETGAHVESLRAVAEKRADVASIDCVTFAFIGDYFPELTEAVQIIAYTADSPALPLFTRADASADTRVMLLAAWQMVLDEPTPLLARLRMKCIEPVTDNELDVIADYERQAVALGYGELR